MLCNRRLIGIHGWFILINAEPEVRSVGATAVRTTGAVTVESVLMMHCRYVFLSWSLRRSARRSLRESRSQRSKPAGSIRAICAYTKGISSSAQLTIKQRSSPSQTSKDCSYSRYTCGKLPIAAAASKRQSARPLA